MKTTLAIGSDRMRDSMEISRQAQRNSNFKVVSDMSLVEPWFDRLDGLAYPARYAPLKRRKKMTEVTREVAQKVLDTVNAGLVEGIGKPIPGQMCVEAAVCFALGLPHGDEPDCVAPSLRALKINLNDLKWSSNQSRTDGLRELALLQLGSKDNLDEVEFVRRVVLLVINKYLPPVLRKINLNKEADTCEKADNLKAARAAAAAAAALADAARADAAAYAAARAAAAARADAYAAARAVAAALDTVTAYAAADAIFTSFAKDVAAILIDMKVPGVQWLNLI